MDEVNYNFHFNVLKNGFIVDIIFNKKNDQLKKIPLIAARGITPYK